ncbi:uracil-DNA glycosylase family protein [Comamonas suwonensis]|jgi:hypothetical protein|uniref:Uracil-DNA glycosylase-like domain-containing protein n=1 Tax=Comamonas suwonensis TaxID=2606214 RepID=A0A843BFH5_9BURK|nr:hypothetical protein [Comamonas suwonensis]MBI1625918.1 hypothetical protein [Comamonas suwonensis]
MSYDIEIQNLYARWEMRLAEQEPGKILSKDGIIDLSTWGQSGEGGFPKLKILFVLREANVKKPNGSWENPPRTLRGAAEDRKHKIWNGSLTFHTVGRWAYGLSHTDSISMCPYELAQKHRKSALALCAHMNLKKTGGKSKSKPKEIEAATERYKEFLIEQIKIINPDVIVCGGTFGLVKKYLFPSMEKESTRIHKAAGKVFINAHHPSSYRKKTKVMYADVVENYYHYKNKGEPKKLVFHAETIKELEAES